MISIAYFGWCGHFGEVLFIDRLGRSRLSLISSSSLMIGVFLFRFEKVQSFEIESCFKLIEVYLYTPMVITFSEALLRAFQSWSCMCMHLDKCINDSIDANENGRSNLTINHLIEIINVKAITFPLFLIISIFVIPYIHYFLKERSANRGHMDNIWHKVLEL